MAVVRIQALPSSHQCNDPVSDRATTAGSTSSKASSTVAWAACCVFLVPKSYETAYFLTDEDKVLMRRRAERDGGVQRRVGTLHEARHQRSG